MRYPDGGGLTAAGRSRRVQVRLAAPSVLPCGTRNAEVRNRAGGVVLTRLPHMLAQRPRRLPLLALSVLILLTGCNGQVSSGLTPPACTNRASPAPRLAGMRPATVRVGGSPFGVVVVPGGRYAVVSVPGPQGRLAVLVLGGGRPRLLRIVTLQPASGAVLGMA